MNRFTVHMAEDGHILCIEGTVGVEHGEDSRGDTVRYTPTVTKVVELHQSADGHEEWEVPREMSDADEKLAKDALCEAAAVTERTR